MPLVEARNHKEVIASLPTVKYPDDVVERLMREVELAKAQIANGELVPKTADDIAAELGIILDD
jgi:hypothetical protein